MKAQYRIKCYERANGQRLFYPQYKILFFWFYYRQIRDISMAEYKIWFIDYGMAVDFINSKREEKKQRKLLKKRFVFTEELF